MDPADQRAIDDAMLKADGSANKGNLGANALLGGRFLMGYFLVSG
jgi:enolase